MGYILDRNLIKKVSHHFRSSGQNVVFTHGAYDLFHVGHITFLSESKRKGDILIVGIESDNRVRKYKHESRPIISLQERMRMVAGYKDVDFVFPIEGEHNLNYKFYGALYKKLAANKITFGRGATYSDQFSIFKKTFKKVDFLEIKTPKNTPRTSQIIERIIERKYQLTPLLNYKISSIQKN